MERNASMYMPTTGSSTSSAAQNRTAETGKAIVTPILSARHVFALTAVFSVAKTPLNRTLYPAKKQQISTVDIVFAVRQ